MNISERPSQEHSRHLRSNTNENTNEGHKRNHTFTNLSSLLSALLVVVDDAVHVRPRLNLTVVVLQYCTMIEREICTRARAQSEMASHGYSCTEYKAQHELTSHGYSCTECKAQHELASHGYSCTTHRFQCDSVDSGTITRKGPALPSTLRKCSNRVTTCTVLPRPISSARMTSRPNR